MASIIQESLEWHEGENLMHSLLHTPEQENPSTPGLSPYGVNIMMRSPLCALGTLDHTGQPWTTLLGGEPAFTRPIGRSVVGIKTLVDRKYDPVVELLVGSKKDGEVLEQGSGGRVVSGLPIDLMTRSRLKLSGKMVAGALEESGVGAGEEEDGIGEIQLVIKIDHSLGNCPKYLNKKQIVIALPKPVLISDSLPLPEVALKLLSKADVFFISSSHHGSSMGTNHRGGPPGFVRVLVNDDSSTSLVIPEYSGNRLYQTLGNLQTTPKAGLVFPDFETQDVLYVTGTTEILIGEAAGNLLPRSNLVVKLSLTAARFVQGGLAFRGITDEFSPYNPPVRFLPTENKALHNEPAANNAAVNAELVKIDVITPTILRARFKFSEPKAVAKWNPGQYVALSFEAELSAGYSHMRDSDPRSLNDDYIRTFTISSPPPPSSSEHDAAKTNIDADEFEITVRAVGVATRFLSRQQPRSGLSVPVKGLGGSFTISWTHNTEIPFVAGGIGITPLLAHLPSLSLATNTSLRLFWMINISDINLVLDTFRRHPILIAPLTIVKVFISGLVPGTTLRPPQSRQLQALNTLLSMSNSSSALGEGSPAGRAAKTQLFHRRMTAADLTAELHEQRVEVEAEDETATERNSKKGGSPNKESPPAAVTKTWYICTAPAVRKEVLAWLAAADPGGEGSIKPVYEDFGY